MKVLITGAAGFLGRRIASRLAQDLEVTATDVRPMTGVSVLDATDLSAAQGAVRGHDAVVHCVALVRGRDAQPLRAVAEVNVLSTWTLAEAAAREGVGTFVYISSIAADGMAPAGDVQHRAGEGLYFMPGDHPYAISKHLGEAIANAYGQAFGMRVLNLRPGILQGDGANPEPQRPPGDPRHWFAHADPDDVAEAVFAALLSDASGTFSLVAARRDSLWDWRSAERAFGFAPRNNWSEL